MPKKFIVFAILSFSLLSYGFYDANALSCSVPITLQTSYSSSEVIFLGNVVSKEYVKISDLESIQKSIVQFEVKEFFKGTPLDFVTLTGLESGGETTFEIGKEYVVFASYIEPTILTEELCALTGSANLIDFDQLRQLKLFNTYSIILYPAIVIAIGAVIITIFVRRKKKLTS